MIKAKYHRDRGYDDMFHKLILRTQNSLTEKDDDFMLMCFGPTGTGKSGLMLHAYELYDEENCTVDNVGLNPKDFATALYKAKDDEEGKRFCGNDEANISKRSHSSKYNKDILDLYFSIRGKKIFHWWNNPSLDMIDKPFIEEKIKGFIFIATKDVHRPRVYYYFTQTTLLKFYEKFGSLKLNVLKKNARHHADWKGWFRKYDGKLLKAYLEKKDTRMDEKLEDFYLQYGTGDKLTLRDMGKQLGIVHKTVKDYLSKLELKEEEDYVVNSIGRKTYTKAAFEKLKEYCKSKISS